MYDPFYCWNTNTIKSAIITRKTFIDFPRVQNISRKTTILAAGRNRKYIFSDQCYTVMSRFRRWNRSQISS